MHRITRVRDAFCNREMPWDGYEMSFLFGRSSESGARVKK